ncbi:hypothetical protein [Maridesulfovibrio bastinii]|uniref:hypothetical protein n=1 Tax=Maridesulfovibrio bastinii TaxID=47157 RepID=UPI000685C970|nr:hypothetical protein [Maridesulfovibrio bastinii]
MAKRKLNRPIRKHCSSIDIYTAAVFLLLFMFCCSSCSNGYVSATNSIALDKAYVPGNATLVISPHFDYQGSTRHNFLGVKQLSFQFSGQNSTLDIKIFYNRSAKIWTPQIGEWNTVSTGKCLNAGANSTCYTSYTDCHLVRTTIIKTSPESVLATKVRSNSRDPEELCKNWNPEKLTENQLEEIAEFNKNSDEIIKFKQTDLAASNSQSKEK